MKRFKDIVWGRLYLWIFRPLYWLENSSLLWHLANHSAVAHWKRYGPAKLSPVQARVLTDLEDAGIALTSLDELYSNGDRILADIVTWKSGLTTSHINPFKPFITDHLPVVSDIDPASPLAAVVLDDRTLVIAGSYLGMSPKLQEFALAEIRELPEGTPKISSMRWHRDPHDRRLLKMFIYLTDVGPDNGPFNYIRHSAAGGKYGTFYPQKPPAGFYPPAGSVEKHVDPADIQACLGKAGTIVFADTAGLHGGGHVVNGHRLMSTAGFLAQKSFLMRLPHYRGDPSKLLPLQHEALLGDEHLLSRDIFKTLKRALLGKESFGEYGTYI